MIIIGLTGPTGAGKSSLTHVAEKLGFQVIDCDKTARRATEKETAGLTALSRVFGGDILTDTGELDRKALAKKAFSSKENTKLLNETLLPFIVDLVIGECKSDKVLLDAPTLIESGLNKKCLATVGVLADKALRLKRIRARDNITCDEAVLRTDAGKDDEFYKENCDYIIYNNGEALEFQREFEGILSEIKER